MSFLSTSQSLILLLVCILGATTIAVPTDEPVQPVQPVMPSNNRHGHRLQATDQFSILGESSVDNRPCNHGNAVPMQYFPPGPSGPVGAPGKNSVLIIDYPMPSPRTLGQRTSL